LPSSGFGPKNVGITSYPTNNCYVSLAHAYIILTLDLHRSFLSFLKDFHLPQLDAN
jgi:hypothetical protein